MMTEMKGFEEREDGEIKEQSDNSMTRKKDGK
jgi:hypothetical protein